MSIGEIIIDEEIMEKIKSIFPSSEFVIKEYNNSIIIKTIDDTKCLRLSFYQDNIYIDSLKKCGVSGSESLKRVYDLAKLMPPNIKSINLTDASDINICNIYISLAILKILTKGISWYNSLGYISDNYDDEKIHNNQIINSDYEQFIDEVYARHFELFKQNTNTIEEFTILLQKFTKKKSGLEMIKLSEKYKNDEELYKLDYPDDYNDWLNYQKKISLYQEIIDDYDKYLDDYISDYISTQEKEKRKGIELYPDVKMTVKDYFNYILHDITSKGCDEETIDKCRWLSGVISKIITTKILQYNNDLKKNILREMGGRKRTKIKKSKTKKVKKSVKSKTKKVKKSVKSNTKKSKNFKKRNYLKSKK